MAENVNPNVVEEIDKAKETENVTMNDVFENKTEDISSKNDNKKLSGLFKKAIDDLRQFYGSKGKTLLQKLFYPLKVLANLAVDAVALLIYGRKHFKNEDRIVKEEEIKNEENEVQDGENEKGEYKEQQEQDEQVLNPDEQQEEQNNNELNQEVQELSEENKKLIDDFQAYINDTIGAMFKNNNLFVINMTSGKENLIDVKAGDYRFSLNKRTGEISILDDNNNKNTAAVNIFKNSIARAYCAFEKSRGNDFDFDGRESDAVMSAISYFLESDAKNTSFNINGIYFNYSKENNGDIIFTVESDMLKANIDDNNKVINRIVYSKEKINLEEMQKDFETLAYSSQEIAASEFERYITSEPYKQLIMTSYIDKHCMQCFPDAELSLDIKPNGIEIVIIDRDIEKKMLINKERNIDSSNFTHSEQKLLQKCLEKCVCEYYDTSIMLPSANQMGKLIRKSVPSQNSQRVSICNTNFDIKQEKNKIYSIYRSGDSDSKIVFNLNKNDEFNEAVSYVSKCISDSINKNADSFDNFKEDFIKNNIDLYQDEENKNDITNSENSNLDKDDIEI